LPLLNADSVKFLGFRVSRKTTKMTSIAGPKLFVLLLLRIVSAISCVVGLALPFLKAGGSERTAFGIIRSARLLGLVDGPIRFLLTTAVVLMPLLTALLVLFAAATGNRLADLVSSLLAFTIGLVGLAVGTVGLWVSKATLVGPLVCAVGGALLLITTFTVTITSQKD
jgi:hypothetical protein